MRFNTRRVSSPWKCLVLMVLFLLPMAAFGQDDRVDQLQKELDKLKAEIAAMKNEGSGDSKTEELERRLDVLAQEIERLKIGEAATSADTSEHGLGPAASKIYRGERGVSIGGYGEFRYQDFEGGESELDLLRAVLYFGYKFNDNFVFNSEIEYEHAGEEIAVEFAYLDYLWRPEANIRAGLLLLPMGFLNELHEPTTFLGANRPETERRIIPSTWSENGLGLFGEAGPFSYRTYVVAGLNATGFEAEGLREGRQEGIESNAEELAWTGRLDFTGIPGLLIGGSAYVGNSGSGSEGEEEEELALFDDRPEVEVGTRIIEGHVEWKWRGLELRALAVQADLDDVGELNHELGLFGGESVGERLKGQYVQAGYDLLAGRGGERALIPYARWETFNTQDKVPAGFVADPVNDVEITTLGIAFKPIDQIVIKADHQKIDNEAFEGTNQFNVLLGWIF
jgi:uncharacterized small protein (DUF1192 family)